MTQHTLIATAAMGIEAVVANEVRALGYEPQTENGRVLFKGDDMAIARANLWLRSADRVRIQVAQFKAKTFDELFERTKALDWARYIPLDGCFPVEGKSVKSTLFSISDCQRIVKKAIVEKLKIQHKHYGMFEETGALYRLEISLLKDVATITLDTTGRAGLHKRGYRVDQGEAPLKETLAAALVQLTNWRPDMPFVDLTCGSGTIAIEAALIGQNIAPGASRSFASEAWSWIDASVWKSAREQAENEARYDQELDITGYDIDGRMVRIAQDNAEEIGLHDVVVFKQMQARDWNPRAERGVMVCNPPYGERLSERKSVEYLYKQLGELHVKNEGWSFYILTSHEGFETPFGKPATKKRKLFNGFIRTDLYQYWGKRPKRTEE
ncbi:MAG: THUMP domain-containing class I SAM-dependent RNA methyltransferase [Bacilli bacterium]